MTCAIQRPACLLIACLAAVISLKFSGKITLRGKRRLTADSVHMGAGNFLSHYMGMRGISRGMIFRDFSALKNLAIH
ncbi:hypothetical protein BVY13_01870 [Bacillus amyloliquefaciens]|nr:hypothetical protein BVY13_01870 [Bacillus amyloliquefaciens]